MIVRKDSRVPSRLSSLGESHGVSRLTFIARLPTRNEGAFQVALSSRGDAGACPRQICTSVFVASRHGKGRRQMRTVAIPNADGVCDVMHPRNPILRSRLMNCHLCFGRGRAPSVCNGFGGKLRVGRSRFCPASRRLAGKFKSSILQMFSDYNPNTLGN